MTGRCCQRKRPEACLLSGSPRVASPRWAMVVLPCSAAIASLATSSKCRRPPALVFLPPAHPPSVPSPFPVDRCPTLVPVILGASTHTSQFSSFLLGGLGLSLGRPGQHERGVVSNPPQKSASRPPRPSISDTSSLSLLSLSPCKHSSVPSLFCFPCPKRKKTPVLPPELRHPHNRGFGQDSSCHSRFLRLDTAYSVSGPAITTLRAAGGQVVASSKHTIPRTPREQRTRVGFSKPRETVPALRCSAGVGSIASPVPSRSAWVPRGKEPCPTKSHPQSPRLARRTRGSLVFFPGDRHNVPATQSLHARPKQRQKNNIPRRVPGHSRTHMVFVCKTTL